MASWLENSASTYTPVGASLFVLCTIESAAWKPQKSRRATDNFSCRAGVPFREEVFGDKGEEQHRLHCLGTRQRRWCRPAPLLCETQPFCARGHIAQKRSEIKCACV